MMAEGMLTRIPNRIWMIILMAYLSLMATNDSYPLKYPPYVGPNTVSHAQD